MKEIMKSKRKHRCDIERDRFLFLLLCKYPAGWTTTNFLPDLQEGIEIEIEIWHDNQVINNLFIADSCHAIKSVFIF